MGWRTCWECEEVVREKVCPWCGERGKKPGCEAHREWACPKCGAEWRAPEETGRRVEWIHRGCGKKRAADLKGWEIGAEKGGVGVSDERNEEVGRMLKVLGEILEKAEEAKEAKKAPPTARVPRGFKEWLVRRYWGEDGLLVEGSEVRVFGCLVEEVELKWLEVELGGRLSG